MPLNPQMMLQPFEKWAIEVVVPIQPHGKTGTRYIIIVTEYLTHWVEAHPMTDSIGVTATKFLFEHVLTQFVYPSILMSDHGTHFLNEMISTLIEEFQVYRKKSTPYHLQANGTVEAFNKVLENVMTKVCNSQQNDWDLHVPVLLWAYRTTCKKLTGQNPFRLVYNVEAVMLMEYIVPRLCITTLTSMTDRRALEERLT